MDRINHITLKIKALALLLVFLGISSFASAEESLGSTIDCSQVDINYTDNPDLTNSERLEAMNNAFFESINRFELCNLSNQSSSSSSTANAAESSASSGSESSAAEETGENDESGMISAASPSMSGTEQESSLPESSFPDESDMPENITEEGEVAKTYAGNGSNGAIPKDIPGANNDDVIAAQIRLAAEIETDPVKKAKLWNEYRKYKGLPLKKTVKNTVEKPVSETTQNTVQFF
jgi:hypothetical protein